MNLADLPWDDLLDDGVPPGRTSAKPLTVFLEAARAINAVTDLTPAQAAVLWDRLGINPQDLLARMQALGVKNLVTIADLGLVVSGGAFDLATRAVRWPWDGIVAPHALHRDEDLLVPAQRQGQALLSWIAQQPMAPTLSEVRYRLLDPKTRGLILRWTTQNFTLVPGFCKKRGQPTLGRPLSACARNNRASTARPINRPRAHGEDPGCLLAEDLTVVIAELATKPAAVRRDGSLHVADCKRLTARLGLDNVQLAAPRLNQAFIAADLLNCVSRQSYTETVLKAGLEWLQLDAGERHHRLLTSLRRYMLGEGSASRERDEQASRLIAWTIEDPYSYAGFQERLRTWHDFAAAWRELGSETWAVEEAIGWWATQVPQESVHLTVSAWETRLRRGLYGLAVSLGLIAIDGAESHATIRLTAAGRWAVGLDPDWRPPATTIVERPIIVQTDHTIVFLSPNTAVEVDIGAFADRLPGAHGSGALFKLSKAACRHAAAMGLDVAHVLRVLQAAASKPIPANVEREISGWFGQLRMVQATQALVITTTDEDTATRLVALLGATRLGPQAVSLPASTKQRELKQRLLKQGILSNVAGKKPLEQPEGIAQE